MHYIRPLFCKNFNFMLKFKEERWNDNKMKKIRTLYIKAACLFGMTSDNTGFSLKHSPRPLPHSLQ